jgi:hypothetical protein
MPSATTDRPPETRLWVVLQRLSRLRDEYSRDKTPTSRYATARAMAEQAHELRLLAEELLAEARKAAA